MTDPYQRWLRNQGGTIPDLTDPTNYDSVPAILTPGEFVMNKNASEMYAPVIEQMNQHGLQARHAGNREALGLPPQMTGAIPNPNNMRMPQGNAPIASVIQRDREGNETEVRYDNSANGNVMSNFRENMMDFVPAMPSEMSEVPMPQELNWGGFAAGLLGSLFSPDEERQNELAQLAQRQANISGATSQGDAFGQAQIPQFESVADEPVIVDTPVENGYAGYSQQDYLDEAMAPNSVASNTGYSIPTMNPHEGMTIPTTPDGFNPEFSGEFNSNNEPLYSTPNGGTTNDINSLIYGGNVNQVVEDKILDNQFAPIPGSDEAILMGSSQGKQEKFDEFTNELGDAIVSDNPQRFGSIDAYAEKNLQDDLMRSQNDWVPFNESGPKNSLDEFYQSRDALVNQDTVATGQVGNNPFVTDEYGFNIPKVSGQGEIPNVSEGATFNPHEGTTFATTDHLETDSLGNITSVNQNRILSDERLNEITNRYANGEINKDQYDFLMSDHNQAVQQDGAYQAEADRVSNLETLEANRIADNNLINQVSDLEIRIGEAQLNGDTSLATALTTKKDELESQFSEDSDFVQDQIATTKAENDAKIEAENKAIANQEQAKIEVASTRLAHLTGDNSAAVPLTPDEQAKFDDQASELMRLSEQDYDQTKVPKEERSSFSNAFSSAFGDLFGSGGFEKILARGLMLYVGGRLTGMSGAQALALAGKDALNQGSTEKKNKASRTKAINDAKFKDIDLTKQSPEAIAAYEATGDTSGFVLTTQEEKDIQSRQAMIDKAVLDGIDFSIQSPEQIANYVSTGKLDGLTKGSATSGITRGAEDQSDSLIAGGIQVVPYKNASDSKDNARYVDYDLDGDGIPETYTVPQFRNAVKSKGIHVENYKDSRHSYGAIESSFQDFAKVDLETLNKGKGEFETIAQNYEGLGTEMADAYTSIRKANPRISDSLLKKQIREATSDYLKDVQKAKAGKINWTPSDLDSYIDDRLFKKQYAPSGFNQLIGESDAQITKETFNQIKANIDDEDGNPIYSNDPRFDTAVTKELKNTMGAWQWMQSKGQADVWNSAALANNETDGNARLTGYSLWLSNLVSAGENTGLKADASHQFDLYEQQKKDKSKKK